jgi:hypothetical protein
MKLNRQSALPPAAGNRIGSSGHRLRFDDPMTDGPITRGPDFLHRYRASSHPKPLSKVHFLLW